jgi:hypothetical protein
MDYELEQQLLEQQLKKAAVLRAGANRKSGGMVGNRYVVDYGGIASNVGEKYLANRDEQAATEGMRSLGTQQDAEANALVQQLNTPGTKQDMVPGQNPADLAPPMLRRPVSQQEPVPDVLGQVPMNPLEENQRKMGVATQLYGLPKSRGLATMYLNQGVAFPETWAKARAAAEEKADAAKLAAEEKFAASRQTAADRAALQAERLQAQKDLQLMLAGMRADTAAANREARAAAKGGSGDSPGKLQFKGETPDGLPVSFSPTTGRYFIPDENGQSVPYDPKTHGMFTGKAAADKDTAATLKAKSAAEQLDILVNDLDKNPKAFGTEAAIVSALPNALSSRLQSEILTPDERSVRIRTLQNAAEYTHSLYGAAQSKQELERGQQFLVSKDDDDKTVLAKLRAAHAFAVEKGLTTVRGNADRPADNGQNRSGKLSAPVLSPDNPYKDDPAKALRFEEYLKKNGGK